MHPDLNRARPSVDRSYSRPETDCSVPALQAHLVRFLFEAPPFRKPGVRRKQPRTMVRSGHGVLPSGSLKKNLPRGLLSGGAAAPGALAGGAQGQGVPGARGACARPPASGARSLSPALRRRQESPRPCVRPGAGRWAGTDTPGCPWPSRGSRGHGSRAPGPALPQPPSRVLTTDIAAARAPVPGPPRTLPTKCETLLHGGEGEERRGEERRGEGL